MLGARERRILDAFLDAMIPPAKDGLGPSGIEAGVPAKIETLLESFPVATRKMFPLALWAVELYPVALGPLPRVFTRLDRAARTRALVRLEHHGLYPLRSAYMALKVFSFLFWAEHPEVVRATSWGERCT
jgi:hypothetical protein